MSHILLGAAAVIVAGTALGIAAVGITLMYGNPERLLDW